MSRKKTNLKVDKIVELVKSDPNIVFVADICEAINISRTTFYEYFPSGSDGYKQIDDALEINKGKKKRDIRDRLLTSNSAASLIFLYKIMTTDLKERAQLDGRFVVGEKNNDDNTPGDITLVID